MSRPNTIQFVLPAAYSSLETLTDQMRAMLEHIVGLPEPQVTIYNLQLAADEIFANITEHAYANRTDGQVAVTLMFSDETRQFRIEMHDTGVSFDPASVPAPDLEELTEGGYGLFLAQTLMDDVIYTTKPDGNRWLLIKRF